MPPSPLAKAFTDSMERLDRKVGWHRVPAALGLDGAARPADAPAGEEPLRHERSSANGNGDGAARSGTRAGRPRAPSTARTTRSTTR